MDRTGRICSKKDGQDKLLEKLYKSVVGKLILKVCVQPFVSQVGGEILNTRISKVFIAPFVKKNGIDLAEYEKHSFSSYNDFFMRKMKEENRPIDDSVTHLISPCDSKLSAYSISKNGVFTIKNTSYTMTSLLRDEKLAERYMGGTILIFRLTVDDYHRYCYVDSGRKSTNRSIQGVFHTVNPVANDVYPIYTENTREYSLLKSEHFGTIIMMEVGALMVGKIVNYEEEAQVKKGQEKGRFEFGGSTVVICLQKEKCIIDADIVRNSKYGYETKVKMGEKIGQIENHF